MPAAFLCHLLQDAGPSFPQLSDANCHVLFTDPAKAEVDLGVFSSVFRQPCLMKIVDANAVFCSTLNQNVRKLSCLDRDLEVKTSQVSGDLYSVAKGVV